VSQSTTPESIDRAVLFQRDGELSEFVDLLSELAVPVDEYTSDLPDSEALEAARIAIISGEKLLESGTPDLSLWPRTIAVVDNSSRTLVTHLNRIGVAMVIRRPIHPRALRLLLLHEIYRGPERRGRGRVLIGHPIRIGSGFFRHPATLLELSPTGARIELANAPKVGTRIRFMLGKELTNNKAVKLQARVIRSIRASEKNGRAESEIGVAILDPTRHTKTIKAILDHFALGPAKWKAKQRHLDPRANRTTSTQNAEATDDRNAHDDPPKHTPFTQPIVASEIDDAHLHGVTTREDLIPTPEFETLATDLVLPDEIEAHPSRSDDEKPSHDPSERRRNARIPYDQRIVALGEEAARVLVGRDLCGGGMRIAATSSVAVGDVLRVALHGGNQAEPLVVLANALRDDGDDGLVLSFDELSESQQAQLENIICDDVPVHTNSDTLEDSSATGEAIVVAEVMETVRSEGEAEIDAMLDSAFDTGESVEDAR